MPGFRCIDPGDVLGQGKDIVVRLGVSRALTLLGIASAPNPGSRYQPGSHWGVVKYATAIDPRLSAHGRRFGIANVGIRDLDPHQKTVLADDLGVAFALARIDAAYGIEGLCDCYALWLEETLVLKAGGRHRRMPDFLLLLRRSLNGSRLALLECKGSTQNAMARAQLATGCTQLDNVDCIGGSRCGRGLIPRIAMALTVHPGNPVELRVDDPPEVLEPSPELETKLRANFVALELAAFGDVAAAEAVRSTYRLPNWARFGLPMDLLRTNKDLRLDRTMLITLPAFKVPPTAQDDLELDVAQRPCLARVEFLAEASARALGLREDPRRDDLLQSLGTMEQSLPGDFQLNVEKQTNGGLRSSEEGQTGGGTRTRLIVDIWPARV
jgi:hypothetical protein